MTIETSTYLRHLERSKSTHNYFPFFRPYMKIMSLAEAVFIQDLINIGSMPRTKRKIIDDEEFFQCTESFLEESGIFWQSDKQTRLFQSLKKKGYVLTKRIGLPATRWMYVDLAKLEMDIDRAEGKTEQDYLPQNCGIAKPQICGVKNKEDKKKENKDCRPKADVSYPSFFEHPKAKVFAEKLMDAVRTKAPDMLNSRRSAAKWAFSFNQLIKKFGPEEVEEVLAVHCEKMNTPLWIEAFAGPSFKLKYENIRRKVNNLKKGEYTKNADGKLKYVAKPKNYVTERVPSPTTPGSFRLTNHFEGTQRYKELVAEGYTVKVQLD